MPAALLDTCERRHKMATIEEVRAVREILRPLIEHYGYMSGIASDGEGGHALLIGCQHGCEDIPITGTVNGVPLKYERYGKIVMQ